MDRIRMASLVFGTAATALGIGFAMQTFVAVMDPSAPAAAAPRVASASVLPLPVGDVVARNDTDMIGAPDLSELRVSETQVAPSCAVSARATTSAQASVMLRVDAPCFPNATVTIHHTGLMFTVLSDDAGHAEVTVPALRERAVFIASVAEGHAAVATTDVPDLAHWTRMAVQWEGEAGLQIHAREFGAEYGDTGHVWAEAPDNPVTGSFLTRLGDGAGLVPRSAEVYSFPRAQGLAGTVALTVETEVTAENCGTDITAEVLDLRGADRLFSRQLDLAMPECAAIGDFLVLNNLMEDLKIATN